MFSSKPGRLIGVVAGTVFLCLAFTSPASAGTLGVQVSQVFGGEPWNYPTIAFNPGGGSEAASPIWNAPLSANPPLDPNSAAIVAKTRSSAALNGSLTASVGSSDWSTAFYFSRSTDPVYRLHCWRYTCPEMEGRVIHIPLRARPAQSCDGHMAVIDQSSGDASTWREWNFSRALTTQSQSCPNGASVGGYANCSTSPCTISTASGGMDYVWSGDGRDGGATAGDFGLAFGQIRPQELEQGSVDHTLLTSISCSGGRVYPAGNNTGSLCSDTTNAPRMGTRFWLDLSDAEIDAINAPPWRKAVWRAMAHYGMIVADTAGPNGNLSLSGEGTEDYRVYGRPDPWAVLARRFGVPSYISSGNIHYVFDFKAGLDWWAHLKVLAPCVSAGTC